MLTTPDRTRGVPSPRGAVPVAPAPADSLMLAPDEARACLATGAVLIDLREAEVRALNPPLPRARAIAPERLAAQVRLAVPDRASVVLLYCGDGRRSAEAVLTLRGLGYRLAFSLLGGLRAWREAAVELHGLGWAGELDHARMPGRSPVSPSRAASRRSSSTGSSGAKGSAAS